MRPVPKGKCRKVYAVQIVLEDFLHFDALSFLLFNGIRVHSENSFLPGDERRSDCRHSKNSSPKTQKRRNGPGLCQNRLLGQQIGRVSARSTIVHVLARFALFALANLRVMQSLWVVLLSWSTCC